MEDAHLITTIDEKGLIGVFDGHGGEQVSTFLSQQITKYIVGSKYYNESLQETLTDSYVSIDKDLRTPEDVELLAAIKKPDNYDNHMVVHGCCDIAKDIGAAALTAIITETQLVIANVGDCRCVLLKGDNEIQQLTVDHRPNLKSEVDRITAAGGFIRNGRVNGNLSLTRAIGDFQFKEGSNVDKYVISPVPDITTYDLDGTESIMVVACDGVWDVLSNEEVINMIEEGIEKSQRLDQICEGILSSCLAEKPYQTPGFDNMTIVVAVFDGADEKWRKCCAGGDIIS
ncbi:protein-serine/threonine phosphatase [Entamoeba marina]